MRGKVAFEYDPDLNVVFTEDDWQVETREDVEAFFADYDKYFSALGKKVYMISHIDNLLVQAQVADYFGELARAHVYKHLQGFARWGTNSWARMTVRTTSHIAKMTANIYTTREEAIQAVKDMRKAGLKPELAPEKTGLT
jgi:hypothetical protein